MPSTRANGSGFFTVNLTESEPLPVSAGAGRHVLAGRVGDSLRGHATEGLRRQPELGRGAGAVGPDGGVADLLAAGAFARGLPESVPSRHAGGAGPASLSRFSLPFERDPASGPLAWGRARSIFLVRP